MPALYSLSSEEFDKEFGVLHSGIFSDEGFSGGPFNSRIWAVVLLPYGGRMSDEDFRCLLRAAETCGDRELVIKDSETSRPSEAAVVIPASPFALEAAMSRTGTNIGVMDAHLFGRSGRWGCVLAASLDDVAVLGGDTEFIARFIEAAGGMAAVRDRFLRFSVTEWSIGEEAKVRLLALAGW